MVEYRRIQKCIESKLLNIPKEEKLPNSNIIVRYVFIGDEAFPLQNYPMRLFSRIQLQSNQENAVLKYNLFKARMTVECSFGTIIIDFEGILKEFNGFVEIQMIYEKRKKC